MNDKISFDLDQRCSYIYIYPCLQRSTIILHTYKKGLRNFKIHTGYIPFSS